MSLRRKNAETLAGKVRSLSLMAAAGGVILFIGAGACGALLGWGASHIFAIPGYLAFAAASVGLVMERLLALYGRRGSPSSPRER